MDDIEAKIRAEKEAKERQQDKLAFEKQKEQQAKMAERLDMDMEVAEKLGAWKRELNKGYLINVRCTDSNMQPTISPQDMMEIIAADPMQIKENDVVFFKRGNGFHAKRVMRIMHKAKEFEFVLASEAGKEQEKVLYGAIVGKVVSTEHLGKKIKLAKLQGMEAVSANMRDGFMKAVYKLEDFISQIVEYVNKKK